MIKTIFTAEPGKSEVLMRSSFDAPRELVFNAFIDPKMIPQWWGPSSLTTRIDKMDARPGGQWRFIQRDAAGNEYAFHGVYHQVARPGYLVFTFEFEGMPGKVLLETITLEEMDGVTNVTDQSIYQSLADRDGMVATGMEGGSTESMRRLAELLAKARNV